MEVVPDSTLEVLQSAALSEDQAEAIFEQGRAAVVFALLELSKRLAEARGPQTTPNTPSGMIPVYEKPPAKPRKKRPGEDWPPFAKKLRRLIGDAIRLWRRQGELTTVGNWFHGMGNPYTDLSTAVRVRTPP